MAFVRPNVQLGLIARPLQTKLKATVDGPHCREASRHMQVWACIRLRGISLKCLRGPCRTLNPDAVGGTGFIC